MDQEGLPFPLEDSFGYLRQIGRAVVHLHEHGFAHRDLKLENCILFSHGRVKLCDFGLSDRLCANSCESVGSYAYVAPEVLSGFVVDWEKCDAWCFGICAVTLAMGGIAFSQASRRDVAFRAFSSSSVSFSELFSCHLPMSTTLKALIDSTVVIDSNTRQTVLDSMTAVGLA